MRIPVAPAPDFDPFIAWYTGRRRRLKGRNPSPRTLRTKRIHLSTCSRLMGATTEEQLGTVLGSRKSVEDLLDALSVRMEPNSMQGPVYALLNFGEYAVQREWIPESHVYKADVPARGEQRPIVVYSEEEIETFVSAARGVDLRWWALLTFLADTGRRIGEALGLQWEWFRMEGQMPYIELPWTKNGEPQYVPLGERLATQVFTKANIAKLKDDPRLVDAVHGPFPWSYSTVHARFGRFCERTGLPNKGFHNFRHSYVTHQLINGVPLQAVSALVGHANVGITQQRYSHLNALQFQKYVK